MKTRQEINTKIKQLKGIKNLLFAQKRVAENESAGMRNIDEKIDGIGKQIRILQWVLNIK